MDKIYVASISFGKDSLAMLLKMLEHREDWPLDVVVFYDTGMEFEAIYKIRDQIKELLAENDIQYVELKPERPFEYDMLHRKIIGRKNPDHFGFGWCGATCRWGTHNKTQSINSWKKSMDCEIVEYIGIAADEPKRIKEKFYFLLA